MPPPPTQSQIDQVAPFLELQGVPTSLVSGFWAAIEAAGLTVVDQTTGAPAQVLETTPGQYVRVEGLPRTYLAGVRVGERGWLTWLEVWDSPTSRTRVGPVFTDGAGQLLSKPLTSGKWTVGTSQIGGTEQIK